MGVWTKGQSPGLTDGFNLENQSIPLPKTWSHLYNFSKIWRQFIASNTATTNLEFVWDGRDHQEKYQSWSGFYFSRMDRWVLQTELFVQAVLDLHCFLPDNVMPISLKTGWTILSFASWRKLHKTKGLAAIEGGVVGSRRGGKDAKNCAFSGLAWITCFFL